METKRKEDSRQPEMEIEQTNVPNGTSVIDASTSKRKSLTGIGTLLLGIAAILGIIVSVIFHVYDSKNTEEAGWTSEKILELVKSVRSGDSSQVEESLVEESLQEVEKDPNASIVDKAIAEAYRLEQVGKIDESIEKWRCIANTAEGINNDLAAGAWFSVGYLLTEQHLDRKALTAYDRSINLVRTYAILTEIVGV